MKSSTLADLGTTMKLTILNEGSYCPGCSSVHDTQELLCKNCSPMYTEDNVGDIFSNLLRKSMPQYSGTNPREKEAPNSFSQGINPLLHLQPVYDSSRGIDSGSRTSGSTFLATGSATNKPHLKKFLGIKNPGSIN